MKFAGKNIILDKEINELDILVLRFIAILEKYTDYVIISGYVAILFGRSRTTEDIDVFITEVSYERFAGLYDEIKKDGFWCLNAEKGDEIYRYLADGCSVRFAIAQQTIPNFEVKFAKKMLDKEAFRDRHCVLRRHVARDRIHQACLASGELQEKRGGVIDGRKS